MEVANVLALALSSATLKEPLSQLANPIAKKAGETLSDVWDIVFGGFTAFAEKKRIQHAQSIEKFKKQLILNIQEIPTEKICEPELRLIGPALEASKYHYEEPEIRDMFAKLIASAMNSDYSGSVHPAFSSVISQLSSLDAATLQYIVERGHPNEARTIPAVQFFLNIRDGGQAWFHDNVIYRERELISKQSEAISSLIRAGLITISDDSLRPDDIYDGFKEYQHYKMLQAYIDAQPDKYLSAGIYKRMIALTSFGTSFCAVCLPSSAEPN